MKVSRATEALKAVKAWSESMALPGLTGSLEGQPVLFTLSQLPNSQILLLKASFFILYLWSLSHQPPRGPQLLLDGAMARPQHLATHTVL